MFAGAAAVRAESRVMKYARAAVMVESYTIEAIHAAQVLSQHKRVYGLE